MVRSSVRFERVQVQPDMPYLFIYKYIDTYIYTYTYIYTHTHI